MLNMWTGTTRKGSAIRHNDNLHSGSAMIVRPVEYIIGSLDGRSRSPKRLCHIDATTRKENKKV